MVKAYQVPQRKVYNMYNYNNTYVYKYINELNIPNGTTKRMVCPNCGERTFSVTNNMGSLLWNCFRASCGIKGGDRVHLSVDDIRKGFTGVKEFAEDTFELPTYVVSNRHPRHLVKWCAEWGIDETELGLLYDVKEDRVVFPVYHNGKIVDATGRALTKRLPKWKRYGKSGLPYSYGCGKVAVVVEDCVSAAVVGYGSFVGVALLGTSLQESHKGFLTQFSTAVIALDPDALKKSFIMAKELRGYVDNVKILKLKDDLKYRNPEDMEKLNGIITD
jgi:hypothetical protein